MLLFADCFNAAAAPPVAADETTFDKYFERREKEKKQLYSRVIFRCFVAMALSAVILFTANSQWSGTNNSGSENVLIVFGFLGSLSLSLAICVSSTVPVEEFDVDAQLGENPYLHDGLCAVLGLIASVVGLFGITFSPYFPSIPLFISGLWLTPWYPQSLRVREECRKEEDRGEERKKDPLDSTPFSGISAAVHSVTVKISWVLTSFGLALTHYFFVGAWSPQAYPQSVLIPGLWRELSSSIQAHQQVYRIIFSCGGVVTLLLVLASYAYLFSFFIECDMPCFRKMHLTRAEAILLVKQRQVPGFKTKVFFVSLYALMLALGLSSFCAGLASYLSGTASTLTMFYYTGTSAALFMPLILTLLIGRRYIFTLLARYFEYDLKRQQDDGALMAFLASQSEALDHKSKVRWVKRRTDAKPGAMHFALGSDFIDRTYWMRGMMLNKIGQDGKLKLRISY